MSTDPNLSRFAAYSRIADAFIAQADKEELAECAQILAPAVAQHDLKFRELPRTEYVAVLKRNDPIDAEMVKALVAWTKHPVGVLGTVVQGRGKDPEPHC